MQNKTMMVPNQIIDNNILDPFEFQIIVILMNEKEFISLSELEEYVTFSKPKILKTIKSLKNKHILSVSGELSDEEAYKRLNIKNNTSKNGCLFCGYNNSFLDKHHYPIRSKDNGKQTISICSNCHREFHYLTDYSKRYKVNISNLSINGAK